MTLGYIFRQLNWLCAFVMEILTGRCSKLIVLINGGFDGLKLKS